ncbi:MAG TPA: heterodisulfide reductase-related iron-sulfur binding cluster, partial [Limnobacter sp.]|nr:heterodisulfide reductase-related iron-sulfur binding cluster [Limnobacter sp.]
NDPAYAEKAKLVSDKTMDIGEFITRQNSEGLAQLASKVKAAIEQERIPGTIAFHPPCTLQHGQQLKGVVENVLTTLGFKLTPVADSHLCCGSAGTYSVLQPELSQELKKRKLANLMAGKPQAIASANIGCLGHLEGDATVEVRHWVEWVALAV